MGDFERDGEVLGGERRGFQRELLGKREEANEMGKKEGERDITS